MDGREAMVMASGKPQYFIHSRGGIHGGGSGSGVPHSSHTELNAPPQFYRTFVNSHHVQPSPASIHRNLIRQSFNPQPHANFSNISIGTDSMALDALPVNEPVIVKKKRGRPRKYGPDGKVALGLLPMPGAEHDSSLVLTTPLPKRVRGRPPGSGRKQRLAAVGEWMNSSAGVAFAPHVIRVDSGEDVAAKMLAFSQQRPRAVCILSGSGTVSLVTLKQPSSSGGNITYEGRFQILCLSGSYLLDEDSGPRNRTGGVSVSLSSPDGHLIGGSVGMLIAAGPVEVVVFSFVYGGSDKPKEKRSIAPKTEEDGSNPPPDDKPFSSQIGASTPNFASSSSSAMAIWPSSDIKHLHTDIDLMRRG